MEYLNPTPWYI